MAGGSCLGLLLAVLMDQGECRTGLLWRLKESGGSPLVSGNQPSSSGMEVRNHQVMASAAVGAQALALWSLRYIQCSLHHVGHAAQVDGP